MGRDLTQHRAQVAVGAVVIYNNAILLVQRKQPPHQDEWCIPGGKIEAGETMQQAAEREILEETGIHIKAGHPIHAFDLIEYGDAQQLQWHYVIIDLLADYLSGEPVASSDAKQVRWMSAADIQHEKVNVETRKLLQEKLGFLISEQR